MATILNVSRKVRPSGEVTVRQSTAQIRRLMAEAKSRRALLITLTDARTGTEFDIRYSLINTLESA